MAIRYVNKKLALSWWLLLGLLVANGSPGSQPIDRPNAQQLLARYDQTTTLDEGEWTGRIELESPSGKHRLYHLRVLVRGGKYLYLISNQHSEIVARILLSDRGRQLYHFDILRNKMTHVIDEMRFDTIADLDYRYTDLPGFEREWSCDPLSARLRQRTGPDSIELTARPLADARVKFLAFLFRAAGEGLPIRVDSLDRDGAVERSLNLLYNNSVRARKQPATPGRPGSFESLNLVTGAITRIVWIGYDSGALADSALFEPLELRQR